MRDPRLGLGQYRADDSRRGEGNGKGRQQQVHERPRANRLLAPQRIVQDERVEQVMREAEADEQQGSLALLRPSARAKVPQ